jgi:predicted nucleic acid-binding protein
MMKITFDTGFFMAHYFESDKRILEKTREILRRSRLLGNLGVVPTIVLAEFYAKTAKKVGASEAGRRFDEIAYSGLIIRDLDKTISRRAGSLRHKYQEKIPWGDCLVAATSLESKTELVITEDPEFKSIKEVRCRNIENFAL